MAFSFTDNSATIGTTEFFLASNSTTKTSQTDDCLLTVTLDFVNMVAGDQYQIKIYEKINTNERTFVLAIVTGAQANPWVSPTLQMGNGWEVGITKLAGTDRSIGWTLRKLT